MNGEGGFMRSSSWARDEIRRLDPDSDARRIVHLTLEVRYGTPLFVHAIFSLAFARQVAVPKIASVLDRDGRGVILTDTRKRNEDTLLFFGELFKHGDDDEGRSIVQRLRRMHAPFVIANDLLLYTLATLACEPVRVSSRLAGGPVLTPVEVRALYVFWRRIGELWGIEDIPDDEHRLFAWMVDYERAHYAKTAGGVRVTTALAREFAERWFSQLGQSFGQAVFYSLFDEHLAAAHGIARPNVAFRALIAAGTRGYFHAKRLLPDPPERTLADSFGARYGRGFELDRVGPDGRV